MLISIAAEAQIAINAQFKARSFNDLAAPYIMYKKFYDECIDTLDNLLEQVKQAEEYISEDKDPLTWCEYVSCYDAIVNEYNSIQTGGTDQNTRSNISRLRKRSTSLLTSIKAAYNKRNMLANEQYNRLRSVEGLTCDRFYSDMSIDNFINGSIPYVNYYTK